MFGYSTAYRSVVRINEREVRFLPSPQTCRKAQNIISMQTVKDLILQKFPELEVQEMENHCNRKRLVVCPENGAFYSCQIEFFVALQEVFNFYFYIAEDYNGKGIKLVIH